MNRVPIIITIILLLVAGAACWALTSMDQLDLRDSERIDAIIAIAACLGAFISATFVVFSYLQTNTAFMESQRPHLLIQVENLHANENDGEGIPIPMSRIHYRNITNNRFSDLTITVKVLGTNRLLDLSDLFRREMTMIGLDSRVRPFNPGVELRSRGFELQPIAASGNDVLLKIGYSYTFLGKADHVDAQEYKWHAQRREWEIC